ncbi:MAG: hypothetical protein GY699_19475 [Desulfobacteraceae bacterium]|nr:hypothetical protein [Desulfobacteraceae bacterium]
MLKKIIIHLTILLFFSPLILKADTLEYQQNEEFVIVVDVMDVVIWKNKKGYSYIDISKGYAYKKHVPVDFSKSQNFKINVSSEQNKKRVVADLMKETWNGDIQLSSGELKRFTATSIKCTTVKNNSEQKVKFLVKNGQISIADLDNSIRKINIKNIKKMDFLNKGSSIKIFLKNDFFDSNLSRSNNPSIKKDIVISGIDLDLMNYFELPIEKIKKIITITHKSNNSYDNGSYKF